MRRHRSAVISGLTVLLGALVLAPVGASAQVPDFSAAIALNPTATEPDADVEATATLRSEVDRTWSVFISLEGTGGFGTFTSFVASPALTGCAIGSADRILRCDWVAGAGDETTLVGTITVAPGAPPADSAGAWLVGAGEGNFSSVSTNLVVLAASPTTTTSTTTTTTTSTTTTTTSVPEATTTSTTSVGPTTSTTSVGPTTTSSGGGPASTLPETGASDGSLAVVAAVLVVLGAAGLMVSRRRPVGS